MSRAQIQKSEEVAALAVKSDGVATVSTRFLADVEKQFAAEMGSGLAFTPLERRLTQHVYLATDQAIKTAESDRVRKNKGGKEITWHTVDRTKLALDTVHRVSLGLDALIPNHIWPVLYFNSGKGMYDIDLRVGYMGRDYVARSGAIEPPVDIIYELVYSSDKFVALPRSASRPVEGYEFEISNPFDRGSIVGGFGYIVHDDPRKNRLVIVTPRDFKRSKTASKSSFWADNDIEMHLKTVVHRTASKVPLDPQKVNASAFAAVFEDDRDVVDVAHSEVETAHARLANSKTIDVQPQLEGEPQPEPEDADLAAAPF